MVMVMVVMNGGHDGVLQDEQMAWRGDGGGRSRRTGRKDSDKGSRTGIGIKKGMWKSEEGKLTRKWGK